MIKKIKAEEVEFYYSNEFLIDESILKDGDPFPDASNYIKSSVLENTCRISITIEHRHRLNKTNTWIDYLYWFNSINLSELDKKIENNTYSDTDFKFSVKTYFVKNLFCKFCNTVYKGALAVDGTLVYFEQWNLAKEKWRLLKEYKAAKKCPNCNLSFPIYVVHIFKDTEEV